MGDSDVISRIPTDLLVSILSRLTLKEAIATSVLSRHWEKLWNFYHGSLEFKVSKGLHEIVCVNHVRVINKVLDTFERVEGGGVFDSFKICFLSCPTSLISVGRCVQFAMEKRRVKRLEFDSYLTSDGCYHNGASYVFPPLKCFITQPRNIQTLTYIFFDSVRVSCEIIEHFLSNCPVLRSLKLVQLSPIYLKVSGETLALRHLVIDSCPHLTTIEISAPNLVSFGYYGNGNTKFDIRNVPKLVELSIGPPRPPMNLKTSLNVLALHIVSCFSNIQKAVLLCRKEPGDFPSSIKLTSLKHLTMRFPFSNRKNILAWTPLLMAFPLLQKLTLDMPCRLDNGMNGVIRKNNDKSPSKCLKVLEFYGFGKPYDVELVMYFVRNIAPLEKIILCCDDVCLFMNKSDVETATSLAGELKQTIPNRVNLEFYGGAGPFHLFNILVGK